MFWYALLGNAYLKARYLACSLTTRRQTVAAL
ncbi:hypothetical protein CI1B_76280 [Bradyrhizobium ivorense]|uniref:Uncharacterized protein n=1 Tax=Bradyrhizobium ivorense TaxID=2511166 RepID=A0A508TX41_9BRAD|nr:hypothetical protein CI1B_76280 [Bradyrhizobium ivorense]